MLVDELGVGVVVEGAGVAAGAVYDETGTEAGAVAGAGDDESAIETVTEVGAEIGAGTETGEGGAERITGLRARPPVSKASVKLTVLDACAIPVSKLGITIMIAKNAIKIFFLWR